MPTDNSIAIQNLQEANQKLAAQRESLRQASLDPSRSIQERLDLLGHASDHANAITKNDFLIALLTASQHTVLPPSIQDETTIKIALTALSTIIAAQQATNVMLAIALQGLQAAKVINGNIRARTT